MICSKCGFDNDAGSVYCGQCGKALKKGGKHLKKSGFARWWWVILLVAALLIGGGIFAWIKLTPEKDGIKDSIGTTQEEPSEGASEPESLPEETTADTTPAQTEPVSEPVPAETIPDGWHVDEEGGCRYYQNNEPLTGLQELEEAKVGQRTFAAGWYLFDETGLMCTGWQTYENNAHYFTEEGSAAAPGWYRDDTGWYCLKEAGRLCRGETIAEEDAEYYVNEKGYLYQVIYSEITAMEKVGTIENVAVKYLALEEAVTNCHELSFRMSLGNSQQSAGTNTWIIWAHTGGEWVNMSSSATVAPAVTGGYTLTFKEGVSFDALYLKLSGMEFSVDPVLYDVLMKFA